MSTGKRLAKRSIIGTRVCAPADDGKFYSGVIQSVKSPTEGGDADTRYSVRFDAPLPAREFTDQQLIGPGFQTVVSGIRRLVAGQRVYLTYNGREVSGQVTAHDTEADEVRVCIQPPGHEVRSDAVTTRELDVSAPLELRKRLDELRLLESRKSARLMDQDTDFARLADMAGDRKRPAPSHSIDVPAVHGSRKRRPSASHEDAGVGGLGLDFMDECTAALVLMSLSCSPHSPHLNGRFGVVRVWNAFDTVHDVSFRYIPKKKARWSSADASRRGLSPSPSASDGGTSGSGSGGSWRSATPSPPLSDGSSQGTSAFWAALAADEGIGLDDDELPRKRKAGRLVFQCTWPGCSVITTTCPAIESHVRKAHLGPRDAELGDREEEFYYTEVQLGMHPTSSPPTLSHRDMARPPHEDPEYQRQLKQCQQRAAAGPINIPPRAFGWGSTASSPTSPQKHLKLSPRSAAAAAAAAGMAHHPHHAHHAHHPHHFPSLSLSAPNKLPGSPTRKLRGDTKKCRKVYGMEHRELWCTQCKWKKACTRFGD